MKLTLNQAVKIAKRGKKAITEAIKDGTLSGPKDEKGRYMIDPSELNRVFPFEVLEPDSAPTRNPIEPTSELNETRRLRDEVKAMQADRIENLEKALADMQNERDDWKSQTKKQTALLEHHAKQDMGFWTRIFGKGR